MMIGTEVEQPVKLSWMEEKDDEFTGKGWNERFGRLSTLLQRLLYFPPSALTSDVGITGTLTNTNLFARVMGAFIPSPAEFLEVLLPIPSTRYPTNWKMESYLQGGRSSKLVFQKKPVRSPMWL